MDSPLSPEPVIVPVEGTATTFVPPPKHPWYSWRRLGRNFLTLSLVVHLLLGIGAAYFVVSVSYSKKKTFGGAPGPGPAQRAAEHKVSMAKTQQRSSAPVALKRVTTTGVSKVALPAMPTTPMDSVLTPVTMSGMGGMGLATGALGGGGGPGGGTGGGGLTMFGTRTASAGLVGTFYDLKQTPSRQPTGMTPALYGAKIVQFAQGGFNTGLLSGYYKAGKPVYAAHVFTPSIPAALGPAAFGVEKEVEPRLWMVHYKGAVTAPESGTFRFVGMGDDLLIVKFNDKIVLDACWYIDTKTVPGQRNFPWDWSSPAKGATAGSTFNVEAGQAYPLEVVIGEQPGGSSAAALLIQKEGQTYQKDKRGADILPYFRMTASTDLPPPPPGSLGYAPHTSDGPVWRAQAAKEAFSVFNH